MKVIYNAISKALLYHCKDRQQPRVFLLKLTGISAFILAVKPGIKLLDLTQIWVSLLGVHFAVWGVKLSPP